MALPPRISNSASVKGGEHLFLSTFFPTHCLPGKAVELQTCDGPWVGGGPSTTPREHGIPSPSGEPGAQRRAAEQDELAAEQEVLGGDAGARGRRIPGPSFCGAQAVHGCGRLAVGGPTLTSEMPCECAPIDFWNTTGCRAGSHSTAAVGVSRKWRGLRLGRSRSLDRSRAGSA
jgi:hypothetical protein